MGETAKTPEAPPGVVAVFMFPDGAELASVADFERSGYGGYTLLEAQTLRAKQAVKWKAVRALCHNDVPDSLDSYEVERIAESLIRKKGYRMTVFLVNQSEPS